MVGTGQVHYDRRLGIPLHRIGHIPDPDVIAPELAGIPVISEDEMREADPDYLLVLAWAFMDEFRKREKPWHDAGGRFLVPLPEVQLD